MGVVLVETYVRRTAAYPHKHVAYATRSARDLTRVGGVLVWTTQGEGQLREPQREPRRQEQRERAPSFVLFRLSSRTTKWISFVADNVRRWL